MVCIYSSYQTCVVIIPPEQFFLMTKTQVDRNNQWIAVGLDPLFMIPMGTFGLS